MYRLVTFDVTGTLLKLRKPVGEIYAEVGNRFDVEADPNLLTSCFKETFVSMNEKHYNFGVSDIGWENWWKNLVTATFQCGLSKQNIPAPGRKLHLISDELLNLFNTRAGWSVVDGAHELLSELKNSNIKLGVISNFDPRLPNILKESSIHDFFSFILTSYECKYMKPDTNIFRAAEDIFENKTNLRFDSSLSLHIGDSFEYDYLGAKRAGWNGAVISKNKSTTNSKVNKEFVFKNLEDLKIGLFHRS